MSLQELAELTKAGRSNCALDATKLLRKMKEYDYPILDVHDAYRECFERMKSAGIE